MDPRLTPVYRQGCVRGVHPTLPRCVGDAPIPTCNFSRLLETPGLAWAAESKETDSVSVRKGLSQNGANYVKRAGG